MRILLKMYFLLIVMVLLRSVTAEDVVFTHDISLHPNYHMWWRFDEEEIIIKVRVNTTGWIGWGISPTGKMTGADMVIGWVDDADGEIYFTDRYARGRYQPTIDKHQDYKLLNMNQVNGTTSVTFKRKLKLTDPEDLNITSDTMRILYSWNDSDPPSATDVSMHTHRGSRSAFLLDYGDRKKQKPPEQYRTFDMRMGNFRMPSSETTYWCKAFKLPDMGVKKHHLIQVETIVTPGNELNVHHILLFQCGNLADEHLNVQHRCTRRNMPGKGCSYAILHAWAIGGTTFYYPFHSGMPLNTFGAPRYLLLEIHYDNPSRIQGILDHSGLRLYYTPQLRLYDSAAVMVGVVPRITYSQIIPPQQEEFTSYGFCSPACMENHGRKTWVYAVGLHTHIHGTKVIVRLVNTTTGRETKVLAQDLNYDFNFQESRYLEEPVEITPGVRIDVDCTYNTMDKSEPLLNGLGTEEEMCLAFLFVSPKPYWGACLSNSRNVYSWGANMFGWEVNGRTGRFQSPVTVDNKTYDSTKAYQPLLDKEFWKDKQNLVKSFEMSGEEETYDYLCNFVDGTHRRGVTKNKPRLLLKDAPIEQQTGAGNLVISSKFAVILSLLFNLLY